MTNKLSTTRRGFLRASIGTAGAALVADGCSHELTTEKVKGTAAPGAEAAERVQVSTTVNGTVHRLDVHPDDSTLEVVRKELQLTGCKLGCGHGACGACTMQLDGTPVATCLLPATALEGRSVTTVEGLGATELHPVQKAFMAEDALQCGYCTPGFVVEAAAFHDAWRKQHGKREPSRDEVAAALCGHLCRCGAYDNIYAAVQGACTGRFDEGPAQAPRYDAREKVTGEAKYTVDQRPPGMLYAKALHSPHAHAIVTTLDWSRALALPGVKGAVGLLTESRRVRFAGQEIMALAAVDERTAEQAIALVDVEYDVKPAAVGMEAALAEGAPVVYATRREQKSKDIPNSSEGPLLPEPWTGNLRGPLKLFSKKPGKARRNIDKARTEGTVVEGTYTTQVQCHTTLEPHVSLAQWEGDNALTVWMSTQAVSHMSHEIAERWGLRQDDVTVICQYIGAGLGSKAVLYTDTVIAVELARVCGAPVLYALDRRQEIMIGGNRPAAKIEMTVATDAAGSLAALRTVTHNDSGVAVGGLVGIMHRIVYPDAPRELIDYDVTNHAPAGKAFRGPAGPQAYFALEQAVDELAGVRGEDPVAVRRRWDPNPARNALYDWVETVPEWTGRPKPQADKGRYRRGIGLATGAWFSFVEPKSRVQLEAGPDGVVASIASQDIGNGTRTIIAKTIAEGLGIPMHDVQIRMGESGYVHGPMSAGSRTTSSVVPPSMHAVEQLKEELVDLARKHFGLKGARVGPDGVAHAGGTMPWKEVLPVVSRKVSVIGKRKRDKGGYFLPPIAGLAPEKAISGAVQVVEVEVDTRLGHLRVLRTWGGYGVGRIIAPALARSQAAGGIVQGVSYALYEERRLDPTAGYLLSAGLEDYRIMGIGDLGEIHIHFDETGYEKIRGRQVGLGEIVTLAPAAAIANAVYDATGWRPRELPLRPDRVLKGVRA